jgi:hypothetical protein
MAKSKHAKRDPKEFRLQMVERSISAKGAPENDKFAVLLFIRGVKHDPAK